jgi:hypothetical protein
MCYSHWNENCFNSSKAEYDKNATKWIHRNPFEAINKVKFSSLFAEAYSKSATVRAAAKRFMCIGIMPLQKDVISGEKYALCQLHATEQDFNATEKKVSVHETPKKRELTPKAIQDNHCSK